MDELTKPFIYLASQSPRRAQLLDQIGVEHRLLLPDSAEDSNVVETLEALEALENVIPGEAPAAYVVRVTELKLKAAVSRLNERVRNSLEAARMGDPNLKLHPIKLAPIKLAPILCADTTVSIGGEILGKPSSQAEAVKMLTRLSGQTHQVLTAVALSTGACANPRSSSPLSQDNSVKFQMSGLSSDNSLHDGSLDPSALGALSALSALTALSVSSVEFATLSHAQIKAYVDSGEPMGKAGAYAVQGRAASFIKNIQGSYSGIMGLPLYETAELIRRLGLFNF